jgi:hypothetical protein
MEREIVFCSLLLLLLEKRKKTFFVVSRTVGFIRDGTRRPERIIMSGDARLSLSYYYFSFFQKNGLGQDEQLLTIRHCRIILRSLFITDEGEI